MDYNSISEIDLRNIIENETGNRFNRQNKIMCPFHPDKTPSLSIRFNSNANKYMFKCFGCNESGDAIDFIMRLKNMDYMNAREYLGLSTEKSVAEMLQDKIKNYIEWQINKTDFRKNNELLGLFQYVDSKNNTLYFKAKFLKPDGSKELSYYHIEGDKVINKRGGEEVPYNLHKVIQAIEDNKTIIICEGEKDANTLNAIFRGYGYVATSIKGVKDLSCLYGALIYVCGDTGEAGRKYISEIKEKLFEKSKAFKIINLPGIEELGDNKDVTDWIEGHGKKDLIEAFNRSLDLKNKKELQQDRNGIYKTIFKDKDGETQEIKKYLTDFTIIEAISIEYVDINSQAIKLSCKTNTGKIFDKVKEVSVFDDVRSFRNFLGAMELSYEGNLEDLIILKKWINKYFIFKRLKLYENPQFRYIDDELCLITNDGIMFSGKVDVTGKSESSLKLNLIDIEPITRTELKELMQRLFNFTSLSRSYSIIGTIINNLAVSQAMELKIKLHHLLIVGESGSGKTTIVSNVVAPILNYPGSETKSVGLITPFALIKELSSGNYTILFDEYKPSSLDRYKIDKLSEILRNLYDRATVSRGDKTFSVSDFMLTRPIVIAGEESYPNQEKALIERSCIIYLAKFERTKEETEAMEYLKGKEVVLNKLGRSLVDTVLSLSVKEYSDIREKVSKKINNLKDRPLNTAVNICTGLEILNKLLSDLKLPRINNYIDEVINNISIEVLEGNDEKHSTVEQMLLLYNSMIEDGRALESKDIVQLKGDGLFIRTSEMINQIHTFCNQVGSAEVAPLKLKDFKKQASKSGYLIKISSKLIRIRDKPVRFDEYSRERMRSLHLDAIIEPDLMMVTDEESKIIDGVFNFK